MPNKKSSKISLVSKSQLEPFIIPASLITAVNKINKNNCHQTDQEILIIYSSDSSWYFFIRFDKSSSIAPAF